MNVTVRPISDRTRFTGRHRRSPFGASWSATERLLFAEVRNLHGRDLVLEIDVTESDIRLDGWIRANARPSTPAVRVAFESDHGPLTYATDRFTSWQDNVRAIALGLEALRKVDRYGISQHGEQYQGWKALPAGRAMPASHMTTEEACRILSDLSGVTITPGESTQSVRARLRTAQAAVHPDRHDGDRTLWDLVEQAAAVLGVTR